MANLTEFLKRLDGLARNFICPVYLMRDDADGSAFVTANPRRAYCHVIAEIENRYYAREPYVRIMPR